MSPPVPALPLYVEKKRSAEKIVCLIELIIVVKPLNILGKDDKPMKIFEELGHWPVRCIYDPAATRWTIVTACSLVSQNKV